MTFALTKSKHAHWEQIVKKMDLKTKKNVQKLQSTADDWILGIAETFEEEDTLLLRMNMRALPQAKTCGDIVLHGNIRGGD